MRENRRREEIEGNLFAKTLLMDEKGAKIICSVINSVYDFADRFTVSKLIMGPKLIHLGLEYGQ